MPQNKFIVKFEPHTSGFTENINLDPCSDAKSQLLRRHLYIGSDTIDDNRSSIKKTIAHNASLRISFGWSFESSSGMTNMVYECLEELAPMYGYLSMTLISDQRGHWLGFLPYNTFEESIYEDLSAYGLLVFNNSLCDFQIKFIDLILNHKTYLAHLILRDSNHRYKYFKEIRHNPESLSKAFHYIMDSFAETLGLPYYPRHIIEEMIACHFLYHPDIFFEILEFYILRGLIRE